MKETFYFSHDYNARHDPKLIGLQCKYGMQGLGIFWCLVEMLHEQGGFVRTLYDRIAYELHVDTDVIIWIINESELFKIEGEMFYSESVKERLLKRNDKSVKARESVNVRWGKYERNTNEIRTYNERNTNKGKESKVKKKEENLFLSKKTKDNDKEKNNFPLEISFEEIQEYFTESLECTGTEAAKFFSYYNSTGWKRGNTQITNWKSAADSWVLKNRKS